MDQSAGEILRAIRDKIWDKNHHCVNTLAKDDRGRSCSYSDPNAAQWCVVGAFQVLQDQQKFNIHNIHWARAWKLMLRASTLMITGIDDLPTLPENILIVNNKLGHDTTLEMLDLAMKLNKEES